LIDSHFVIDDDKGLQGETVYEIREDRQGNLWLSLSNGISRVEISSPFSYWNKIQGLNAYVTDIFKYNDTVYISTENGIFYLDGKGVKKIGTLNDQCWDIHLFKGERGEKQLLAGTNSGLFEIKNNRLINHYNRPTMVVSSLYSTPEFPELLFVGQTDGFSVLKNTGDEWKEIEYIENTGYDIRSIARDKEGNFWIGTFRKGVIKGQYFPEAQRFVITKHYGENSGFPSLKNVNVFPYSKHLVFGTEKGFYKYDSRRDTFIIDSVFGEPYITGSSGVFAFEETENNKVWVTGLNSRHSKLGYGIPDKDGIYRWTFEPFERLPGMMTLALFVESDSIFWIGGSEGIYKYNSRNNYNYGKNHKTLLRNIFVGKDSLIFAGNLPISLRKKGKQVVEWEEPVDFKYNTVSFYFSLPFFDGKSANSYQYYLEGFDKDWSDWQSTGFKQYTNLPEGDYVFHARGKNIYNQIAREAIFRFTVNPPWYRTFLAYIIYVLLGAFIIWVIIRIYTNNLKAANIRLEEKVKERTHEIAQQKEEIEQQRDSIYNQARQLELINAELNKLSIAVRETDNAIILMDKEGKLEWINEGFTRLYGYNIEEAKEYLGQYPVKEKKNEKLKEHFKKVIEDNSSHIYESSITAKSGEHIVTQTTLTPITDESGEISYVVAIDSDIRKLKQVEEELQKLNATKDKFFSIIAHDLKNPFHSLVAAIKTLRMKINDYPKDKILYFLENMEDVAEKGYDLLINLLEWSRSQTGRLNFRTEEYNLHDLVKSSIDLLKTYANNKGVKIMNQVDKSVSVKADKNTISTVLRNLISNAIKYSTKGDKVRIYCKEKEGFCYVYVEDTGIGIKKEDLNKLFRIDQNFSTRGTQEEAGTGLGLILCKEFVEKNGGEIFVESEPGKGTTFSFYLQKG
jgi:PAS domain S-box-containing protein